jgi:hypothetical protein
MKRHLFATSFGLSLIFLVSCTMSLRNFSNGGQLSNFSESAKPMLGKPFTISFDVKAIPDSDSVFVRLQPLPDTSLTLESGNLLQIFSLSGDEIVQYSVSFCATTEKINLIALTVAPVSNNSPIYSSPATVRGQIEIDSRNGYEKIIFNVPEKEIIPSTTSEYSLPNISENSTYDFTQPIPSGLPNPNENPPARSDTVQQQEQPISPNLECKGDLISEVASINDIRTLAANSEDPTLQFSLAEKLDNAIRQATLVSGAVVSTKPLNEVYEEILTESAKSSPVAGYIGIYDGNAMGYPRDVEVRNRWHGYINEQYCVVMVGNKKADPSIGVILVLINANNNNGSIDHLKLELPSGALKILSENQGVLTIEAENRQIWYYDVKTLKIFQQDATVNAISAIPTFPTITPIPTHPPLSMTEIIEHQAEKATEESIFLTQNPGYYETEIAVTISAFETLAAGTPQP